MVNIKNALTKVAHFCSLKIDSCKKQNNFLNLFIQPIPSNS